MVKKNRQIEDQIQASIVTRLRLVGPDDLLIHHSRNEGNRGGKAGLLDGVRGKKMGVCAGFPDLLLIHAGMVGFIEVKTDRGGLTASQKDIGKYLSSQGFNYAVCKDQDEAAAALKQWGWS